MRRPDVFTALSGLAAVAVGVVGLAYCAHLLGQSLAVRLIPILLICLGIAGLSVSRVGSAPRIPKGQ